MRTLENDGVLVSEAEGNRVCILVVGTVYLGVTVGIPDDPSQPADPLGSAKVHVPVAFVGTIADAVPESLVAAFHWCMTHPETSSYDVSTEDLAEVLFCRYSSHPPKLPKLSRAGGSDDGMVRLVRQGHPRPWVTASLRRSKYRAATVANDLCCKPAGRRGRPLCGRQMNG